MRRLRRIDRTLTVLIILAGICLAESAATFWLLSTAEGRLPR